MGLPGARPRFGLGGRAGLPGGEEARRSSLRSTALARTLRKEAGPGWGLAPSQGHFGPFPRTVFPRSRQVLEFLDSPGRFRCWRAISGFHS